MENLLMYDEYYHKVKSKYEQELLYTAVHIIYDAYLLYQNPLTNRQLHCLMFLVNLKRYELNLGFYKNDEIPEFEKWTLGYDAWNKGPVVSYIQKIIHKFEPSETITQADFKLLYLRMRQDLKMPGVRNIITDTVDAYGSRKCIELAGMIAEFLRKENSSKTMKSYRKTKIKFEV